jgi:hypothetical protein
MGEVYVRAITTDRLNVLEELARSDSSDADVVRKALELAGRNKARAEGEKWQTEDGETGADIAAAATADDLEAVAVVLLEKLSYLYKGPNYVGDEIGREAGESCCSFLRRVLKSHQQRTRDRFARIEKNARDREAKRLNESFALQAKIMQQQTEASRKILRGAEALPRVEQQLEASTRSSEKFNQTTTRIAIGSLIVAVVSMIVATVAVVKSYQDDPKIDSAMDALKTMQQESKATSSELRALREELNRRLTPPQASNAAATKAPAEVAPKK